MYWYTKETDDDAGDSAFVVVGTDFSTIREHVETIGYFMRLKFTWGYLLMEFMGLFSGKTRGVHGWTVI